MNPAPQLMCMIARTSGSRTRTLAGTPRDRTALTAVIPARYMAGITNPPMSSKVHGCLIGGTASSTKADSRLAPTSADATGGARYLKLAVSGCSRMTT